MTPSEPKIAYVLKRYPRYSETFIVNEILAHEEAGRSVEIVALRSVEETHFQDILGRVRAPVIRIPERLKNASALWSLIESARGSLPGAWDAIRHLEPAQGRDVAQALQLALVVHSRGIAHLHAHFGTVATTVARLAAAFAGIGYSFTAHAKDIYCDYEESQGLDLKLRDAAAAVTVSDFNAAHLRATHGRDADRVVRIYNGIDLERFAWSGPAASDEILAVGRLVEKKGFHILLEAIRLMRAAGRPVRCRIVGAGEEGDNLAAQVAASGLGDAVTLAGPLPQAAVIAAMRGAGVLACPCVVGRDGNRDGLPTVLLEAMALGTACVATDVTGIPELVRDGETGLCVPEAEPEALAAALARMLDDPALRKRVAQGGRALVEQEFDLARNAAHLRAVFDAAIAGRSDHRAEAPDPGLRRGAA
jgi:colanic acid/amylovoran biosynthesis glycosyltransferase